MNENVREICLFALTGVVVGWVVSWVAGSLVWGLFNGILGAFAGSYVLTTLKIDLGIKNPSLDQIAKPALGAFVVVVLALLMGKIFS